MSDVSGALRGPSVAAWLGVVVLTFAACSDGDDGALSLPPADGGGTVTEALDREGVGDWTRGFLVAVADEPVRLCEALAESNPPTCSGASLMLGDGVIWREPVEPSAVIGSVRAGVLTDGLDDPGGRGPALACGYTADGPCSGFPGVSASQGVWWTDIEYSVAGVVEGGRLTELRGGG